MPDIGRRGFLHLLGAAGLTPFLPALPARAAVPTASVSKMLWSGIYAKSGSGAQFAKVAHGMGLSGQAVQRVGARSVGVRITAAAAARVPVASAVPTPQTTGPQSKMLDALHDITRLDKDVAQPATPQISETAQMDALGPDQDRPEPET